MKKGTLVIIGIVAIIVLWGISVQRGLVGVDEGVKKAWNNVEAEYQNRADLVNNLVNTVKGAADFEKSTLTDVISARAKATSVNINADDLTPEKIAEYQAAQAQLSGSLSRLLVSVERYPELKANENFKMLQGQLEGIENNIKNSRKVFNEEVASYNKTVRVFPKSLMAGILGFKAKEGFKADPGSERAPSVQF